MKKLILLPIVFCLYSIAAYAQPSFIFPTQTVVAGEQFCVDVKTKDFTTLLLIEKTFEWDPSVIRFDRVNILSYDPATQGFPANVKLEFNEDDVADGRIHMFWEETSGVSHTISDLVEDNFVMFQFCFEAIGTFGASTEIWTADDPKPRVLRQGSGNLSIGCNTVNGLIGTDVLPVKLYPVEDPTRPNQGDFFCVDYAVDNFRKIVGFQFTIEYDPAVIEFDGVNDLGTLRGLNPRSNFLNIEPGIITGNWFSPSSNETLADGTAIFGLCFRAIGDCEDYSFIKFTSSKTPLEIYSGEDPDPTAGTNIRILAEDALVRIQPCNQSGDIKLTANCPEALPGETVFVEVAVDGFQTIIETDFLVKWNSNVLEYRGIDFPSAFMPTVDANASNIGTLSFKWKQFPPTGPGITLSNGTRIFTLEFLVIGDGTVSSSVSFPTNNAVFIKRGSNRNVGLVASNGCVEVNAPPGLTLTSASQEAFNGDQVCIDVTTANFDVISFAQFTINYNSSFLQYDNVSNFGLSSINASNFTDLGNGNIGFEWDANMSGFGESLPNGEVIFTLCFTIIGDPSPTPIPNCAFIQFTADPQEIIVNSETTGPLNIGLNSNDGNICILDPGFFTVSASENEGCLGDQVCIDVIVENCNEITSFQFSTSWNNGPGNPVVEYAGLNFPGTIPNFDATNFDVSSADLGIVTMLWDDQTGDGVTLPDGSVIFSVCFDIIGDANNCTNFSFQRNPLDIIVTSTFSNGNNIGLNSNDGEICATDYLRIQDSTVTNVGCPGSNSGAINMRIAGGVEPYKYDWTGTTQNTQDINNLAVGNYSVIISDSDSPSKSITANYTVDISGDAPVADAGDDRNIPCNDQPVILDGTASSDGADIAYRWFTIDTGILIEPSDRTSEATAGAEGTYILEVLNTQSNCVSYDTVMVIAPNAQPVSAGDDKSITCFQTEANLDGSAPGGSNARFFWRPINGGVLDPTTDSTASAIALTPGCFELTARDIFTGCEGRDTVCVFDNSITPQADAGQDRALPCMADTITIGGSNTAQGSQFVFEWKEIQGGNIVSGENERAARVNSIGLYSLEVTDTLTGCFKRDTVEVIGDPDTPQADAGPDLVLDCDNPSLQLQSQNSSQNGAFGYLWETVGGGSIPPGDEIKLQPTISTQGRYLLTVTNLLTQCQSFSAVTVTTNMDSPNAQAGADIDIGCKIVDILVDGTGTPYEGTRYEYQWTTDGTGTISTPDSLITTLSGPGEYILNVKDTENGCVGKDTMNIFQDTTQFKPIINLAPPGQALDCRFDVITLNALGSDNGSEFTLAWGPANNIVNGQGTLTPAVNAPGEYIFSIIHDSTQCTTSARVTVESDTIAPVVTIPIDQVELPCDPQIVQIAGMAENPPPNITYNWFSPSGATIQSPNAQQTAVFNIGTYSLYITNDDNGCNSDTVQVNVTPAPSAIIAEAGANLMIDCDVLSHDIDGAGSSTEPGLAYLWIEATTGDTVSTTLEWTVEDAGTYVLLIMDANGCQAVDTLDVTANSDIPTVNAGMDQSFTCFFNDAILEGSFDADGATNVNVTWTTVDGAIVDPSALNATVTAAGTYVLTVINEDNNCTNSDEVSVTVSGTNLTGAEASFDNGTCENFATIEGNLPPDVTGAWTSLSGGVIDDPSNPMTMVNDLPVGVSTFVWSLSTADCPNYSFDTINITITGSAGDLSLRNDLVTLPNTQDSILIEYLLNDDIDVNGNWDITIIEQPDTGRIINEMDGSFTYVKAAGYSGFAEVVYSVCNVDCMDQCDTALVRISIEADEIVIPTEVPNAITPNGDGLNDNLVFDILEIAPNEYPNNELTVFNRWGNVVHKSKPYLNDWQGTGRNGKPLPHGTYYYILRLDISEGMIIRGDVTILK